MEENVEKPEPRSGLRRRQLLTALSPLLSVFILGLTYGFGPVIMSAIISTIHVGDTRSGKSNEFEITDFSQIFWIVPGNIVSMIPSCCLSGFLMEKFGRRKLFILAFPLFIISWLLIGCSTTVRYLTIGRLIGSLAGGLIIPLVPVYIGETSDPVFRGVLLSMISATLTFGVLISNGLSILTFWRGNAYICALLSLIGWLSCLGCRESPIWLMNKGHSDQAVKQWVHLRGQGSMNEYRAMERVSNTHSEENGGNRGSRSCWSLKGTCSRHFLWPLATMCILSFTLQFSGFTVATIFCVDTAIYVTGFDYPVLRTLCTRAAMLVVNIVVCCLMLKCKRRTLAMVSCIGTMSTWFLASAFELLGASFWTVRYFFFFVLLFVTIGLSPLSWVFIGELFPRQLRSCGAGLASGFATACMFADVKMVASFLNLVDVLTTLVMYGTVTMVGTLLLYWKLPETKGKTLLEIETIFDKEETEPADTEMMEYET